MDDRFLCGILLSCGIALAGCATHGASESAGSVEVVASTIPGTEGLLNVQVTNLSNEERCVPMEVVHRPRSAASIVDFWHRGRPVPIPSEGYLLPQLAGYQNVSPGESIAFQVDVRRRFLAGTVPTGDMIDVSVGIQHWRCSALGANLNHVAWSRKISIRNVTP